MKNVLQKIKCVVASCYKWIIVGGAVLLSYIAGRRTAPAVSGTDRPTQSADDNSVADARATNQQLATTVASQRELIGRAKELLKKDLDKSNSGESTSGSSDGNSAG